MNSQPPETLHAFETTVAEEPSALPGVARPAHTARPRRAWWRLAATSTGITLVFDGAVFAAMAVLGWKLVTPWSEALTAGESLMAIGLIVCAGLWASICADDLYRWRKLCRRWSAQPAVARRPMASAETAVAPSTAAGPEPSPVGLTRPRVRSVALPSRSGSRALSHTPWHVVTRH